MEKTVSDFCYLKLSEPLRVWDSSKNMSEMLKPPQFDVQQTHEHHLKQKNWNFSVAELQPLPDGWIPHGPNKELIRKARKSKHTKQNVSAKNNDSRQRQRNRVFLIRRTDGGEKWPRSEARGGQEGAAGLHIGFRVTDENDWGRLRAARGECHISSPPPALAGGRL